MTQAEYLRYSLFIPAVCKRACHRVCRQCVLLDRPYFVLGLALWSFLKGFSETVRQLAVHTTHGTERSTPGDMR